MGKKHHKSGKSKKHPQADALQTSCKLLHHAPAGFSAQSTVLEAPPSKIASNGPILAGGNAPNSLARILRPQAATRWSLPGLAAITPQHVEMVLRGALAGNHAQQWELMDMMQDTWPELAGCVAELTEGVMAQKLIFAPFTEEGEAPTDRATKRQKLVSTALRRMRPHGDEDENDLEGTLKDIIGMWFAGTGVLEIDWQRVETGTLGTILAPRSTIWAHPSYFGWAETGRLCLRLQGRMVEMPPNKFIVGIHKSKSGSAVGNSLLRPLAWWWCASNFASDWLLNLAQLFGMPFRWANYDPNAPQATVDAICNMLQNMGSAGWAAFPAGTTLEMKHESVSGDHSPQGELLDRADRYARMLILGQTMSGGQDSSKGGGKAFGTVEAGVKDKRIAACSKFAVGVINQQLSPAIVELNYGDREDVPLASLIADSEGSLEEAQRDKVLSEMMPLSIPHLRQKYNMPEPAEDEESTNVAATGPNREDPVLKRQIAYATWKEERKAAGLSTDKPPEHLKTAARDDAAMKAKYDPAQPRDPGGTPTGGRWSEEINLQNNGKNRKFKRDRNSQTQPGNGSTSGGTAGDPGTAASNYLGRVSESDSGRMPRDLNWVELGLVGTPGRLQEEQRALRELAHDHPEMIIAHPNKVMAEGSEHTISLSKDGKRVWKEAKEFGYTPFSDMPDMHDLNRRAVDIRRATPSEYIERMKLSNRVFGDDVRIEGVTYDGRPVISQRFIKGRDATPQEIDGFMRGAGYQKLPAGKSALKGVLADTAWIHPKDKTLVADLRPANVKLDAVTGKLVPIDVIIAELRDEDFSSISGRDLAATLVRLTGITDDAIFAKELNQLIDSL